MALHGLCEKSELFHFNLISKSTWLKKKYDLWSVMVEVFRVYLSKKRSLAQVNTVNLKVNLVKEKEKQRINILIIVSPSRIHCLNDLSNYFSTWDGDAGYTVVRQPIIIITWMPQRHTETFTLTSMPFFKKRILYFYTSLLLINSSKHTAYHKYTDTVVVRGLDTLIFGMNIRDFFFFLRIPLNCFFFFTMVQKLKDICCLMIPTWKKYC